VASTLGDRIGVLVPLEGHIPEARALVRGYGMSGAVADIAPLGEYGRVRDLGARREALTELMAAAVRDQVARVGVDVVIPLGGALIPEIVDPHEVRGRAGIPVLNLKRLAIRHAETCVELGIVHSPATYPRVDLTLADYSAYAFRTSE